MKYLSTILQIQYLKHGNTIIYYCVFSVAKNEHNLAEKKYMEQKYYYDKNVEAHI